MYLPSMKAVPVHCMPSAADADRIADRLAEADEVIKRALVGADHDGAGQIAVPHRNQIAVGLRRARRKSEQPTTAASAAENRIFPRIVHIP